MSSIFGAYTQFDQTVITLAFTAYECILFFVFEKLKKIKILRFFAYMAISFVHAVLCYRLLMTGWVNTGVNFIDWFYLNTQEIGEVREYTYLLFGGLGFFMISVLYYFTCYRFRIFGVMLTALFPFVIYGKRSENMSTLTVTFIMTIFLAMMVHQKHVTDDNNKNDTVMNLSYVIGTSLFVTFVGAVTMVLPKPEYKSALEEGRGMFRYTFNTSSTEYDDLSDVSSPRFGADATGELLFTVTASDNEPVIYIRRQSFDVFAGDNWVLDPDFRAYKVDDDTKDNEVNSPKYLYDLLKSLADKGGYEKYGLERGLFGKYDEYDESTWLNLSSARYSPDHVPAPLLIKSDTLSYASKTPHGEVYYSFGTPARYGGFGVSYSHYMEGEEEYRYIASLPFSKEGFEKLMSEAYVNGDITPAQYSNLTKLMSIYCDKTGISEGVDELAHEITDGYDTDYDKANALVEYFIANNYEYDLDYEPEDESIEYFLFESKTGVCTSYATAMTLMARAVGIPARYVEGFVAYEKNEVDAYLVRDTHAHAFVEVFIPGAGWVTFDPTVPDYRNTQGAGGNNADIGTTIKVFMEYLSRIVLFLAVIFVVIFIIFIDRIIEVFFRLSLKFVRSSSKKSVMIYKRIVRLIELSTSGRENVKGLSPWEIDERAKQRDADVHAMIALFEASCFGSYEPSKAEFDEAYAAYKSCWGKLIGKKRTEKKAHKKSEGAEA